MVSPIWRVIALKVAAARFTLLASLCTTSLTKQLWATVVAALLSVKMFTTVELWGFVAPVMSVAPWVPIPGSHVAAKNETRDNRTSRYESNNASLSCQFYFKKIHFYSLTSFKVSHSESRRAK